MCVSLLKYRLLPRDDGAVGFYQFLQFIFYKEWLALKDYANSRGVKIIGDIPIFVSMDSADVWANKELFQLDTKGYPTRILPEAFYRK